MSNYYVYILINSKNHIYTGITNNLLYRLEKHNTKRGARATKKDSTWKFHKVYGLFTKSRASRFEWYLKHEKINNKWKRLRSGLEYKMKHLKNLLLEDEWCNIIELVNL